MTFINTVLMPGLTVGASYALIAVGFAVLFRTTGVLNFAQGAMVMAGPTAVLVAEKKWGLPTGVSVVVGVVAVVAFALIAERVAIRPFLQSESSLAWILSTLGVSVVLVELLSIPFGGQSQAFDLGPSTTPLDIGGVRLSPLDLTLIAAPFALVLALRLFYRHTTLGTMLQAVAQDVAGASAIGISKSRMSQMSAAMAALVAVLTGFLLAPTQLANPNLGITYTFSGFVAAAIGGIGSIEGALVGGLLVGVLGQVAAVYVGSLYVNAALFAGLLLVYMIRPFGIFGRAPVRAV
jgi:branched-chain amino acid transport system permease protein